MTYHYLKVNLYNYYLKASQVLGMFPRREREGENNQ